jgi:hypothetical protein
LGRLFSCLCQRAKEVFCWVIVWTVYEFGLVSLETPWLILYSVFLPPWKKTEYKISREVSTETRVWVSMHRGLSSGLLKFKKNI